MWIELGIMLAVFIAILGYLLIYSGGADDYDGDTDDDEICGECESYNRWFCCCDETNGYRKPSDHCNARRPDQFKNK